MIPKEAFAALTALMLSAWAFGIVCDRLFSAWMQGHGSEEDEEDEKAIKHKHDCNTCVHEKVKPKEEPCFSCLTEDFDMWEGK